MTPPLKVLPMGGAMIGRASIVAGIVCDLDLPTDGPPAPPPPAPPVADQRRAVGGRPETGGQQPGGQQPKR